MKFFWYKPCPFCSGQGRLVIMKDTTNMRLYLHCDECERGWLDPRQGDDIESSFLTVLEDYEAEVASKGDIIHYGWQQYALYNENGDGVSL